MFFDETTFFKIENTFTSKALSFSKLWLYNKHVNKKKGREIMVVLSVFAFVGIISLVVYSASSIVNTIDDYDKEAVLYAFDHE
jgi:hypothetical protein